MMDEDAILDALISNPLTQDSLHRVAKKLLIMAKGNDEFSDEAISVIQHDKNVENLRSKIWSALDKGDLIDAESARLRIIICAISEVDILDDQIAEMLFFWSEKIGLDVGGVVEVFKEEMRLR